MERVDAYHPPRLDDVLNCFLCKKTFIEPTTIMECLHTFCKKCIYQRLKDGVESEDNSCPECNIALGHHPTEKLRPDKLVTEVLEKLEINYRKGRAEDDNKEIEIFQETIHQFCNSGPADFVDILKQLKSETQVQVNAISKKSDSLERQLANVQKTLETARGLLEVGLKDLSREVPMNVPGMRNVVDSLEILLSTHNAQKGFGKAKNIAGEGGHRKAGKGKRKRAVGNGVGLDEEDLSEGHEVNYLGGFNKRGFQMEHAFTKQEAIGGKKRFRSTEGDGDMDLSSLRGDGFQKEKQLLDLDANEEIVKKDHPTKPPSRVLTAMVAAKALAGTGTSFGLEVLNEIAEETQAGERRVPVRPPLVKGASGCGPPHAPSGWGWMVGQRRKGNNHRDVYFWPPGVTTSPVRTMRALRQYFAETIPGLTEEKVKELVSEFTRRYWLCPWLRGVGGAAGGGSGPEGSDLELGSDDEALGNTPGFGLGPRKGSDNAVFENDVGAFNTAGSHGFPPLASPTTFPGAATTSDVGLANHRLLIDLESAPETLGKGALGRSPHDAETELYENTLRCTSGIAPADTDSFLSDGDHHHARMPMAQQRPPRDRSVGVVAGQGGESARVGYDFVSSTLQQSGRTALIRQSYAHNLYANLPHRAEALDLPDTDNTAATAPRVQQSTMAQVSPSSADVASMGGEPSLPLPSTAPRSNLQGGPLWVSPAAREMETGGGGGAVGRRDNLMWLGSREAREQQVRPRSLPQTEDLLPSSPSGGGGGALRSSYTPTGNASGLSVARNRWSPPPRLESADQQQNQHGMSDRMRSSQPPISPGGLYGSPGRRTEQGSYKSLGAGEGVLNAGTLNNMWGTKNDERLHHAIGSDRTASFHQRGMASQDGPKQIVQDRPATQPVTLFGSVISGAQTSTAAPKLAGGQGPSSSQSNIPSENMMPMPVPALASTHSPLVRASEPEQLCSRTSLSPEGCHRSPSCRVSPSPEMKKGSSAADVVRKHFNEAICRSQ